MAFLVQNPACSDESPEGFNKSPARSIIDTVSDEKKDDEVVGMNIVPEENEVFDFGVDDLVRFC